MTTKQKQHPRKDRCITPASSYLEISKIIDFLEKKASDLNLDIDKTFVSWVGLYCCGKKEKDLIGYKNRTNHYLKESLKVNELPLASTINKGKINKEDFKKLYESITNKKFEQSSSDITFKKAVSNIAKATLDLLREKELIRGSDANKYIPAQQKQKFSEEGFLIIPSVLTDEEVKKLSKLTLFIAQQEDAAGVSYRYGGEDNKLQRIYNLISKHPCYITLLEKPIIKEMLEWYFQRDNLHHKYVLSSFQSNIIHPGGGSQQLHVDGWSFNGVPLPKWSTRLNVNYLLTDWTENNGSTLVAPGSNKLFRCPKPGEVADDELLKIIAPKGSLVFWSGHTWHKSGTNNSNHPRFGLFACFAASQLKEVSTEEEHLLVVDDEVKNSLSPEMKFMIGMGRGVKKGALHRIDFSDTLFKDMEL